jgi:hypothetical protein
MATFVLDGGLDIVTNRIKGAGTEPLNVGWGTAAGTTARTDTTLFTEKLVDLTTSAGTDHTAGTSTRQTTNTTNDTYQVVATRTATGAGTVTNAGLLSTLASAATSFSRVTLRASDDSPRAIRSSCTIKAIFDN